MQELKKAGLKITIPRVTILEILQNADQDHHFSAEEMYNTLRENDHEIGLATVYRVMSQFEQAGILRKHHFESGQAKYELDTGDNHDHIICVACPKIVEFTDKSLEKQQKRVAKENGFEIEDHSLILYGLCAECREKDT